MNDASTRLCFEPTRYLDVDASDKLSNRVIALIHVLGIARLWTVLDYWSGFHCIATCILVAIAEYVRIQYPCSYYNHRNKIAVALLVFAQGGPGGWQIYFSALGKAPSTFTNAAVAAATVYILGSFFFFNRPWQFSLLPHMASSILILPLALQRNPAVCDTAVMKTEAGQYISQQLFKLLDALHAVLAPRSSFAVSSSGSSGDNVLSPRSMCVCNSNTLMVAVGFLLPTLLLAVRESEEYCKFKNLHNGRGKPVTWLQLQVYNTLGSRDAINRIRVFLIMTLLLHIT